MTEPQGSLISPSHRRYRLEPGDGTRYEFSITWLAVPRLMLGQVVAGVANGEYITLTIHDYMYPGSYEFLIDSLRDTRNMRYFIGKMPHARKSDVVAIALAAGVLANGPGRVEEACKEMLRAEDVLDMLEKGEL